ncbi:restriction endonuclease fold toxin-2 domain-containing protein [Streptomyces albus]|uniref:restriction endonuclease fold toxin-2 domain-containing protein n=1 Tax=Streptomyces albus TaxID=1888 RepID=UPI0024AE7FB9|nr:restriction endonuclease fold toxin-2 domain-containing protein [Streptomyces albus]MDI6408153.1 restriction endonuclease fold toxin-2 domain-containing protein [Streptomyces albus]
MGDHEGMHLYATNMIKGSMGLVDVMKGVRDTTIALSTELGARQKGMAGDDDAGHNFSKVYTPAAKTTLDQLGFSAYVVGQTGAGLMRTAREFMAQEDKFVAAILGKQQDLTAGMADPSDGCDGEFLNRGQKLPDVVGDTAWHHQYLASQRFRGDAGKARDVASSWRQAGKILDRLLDVAQGCARAANKAHGGEAADAFDRYFKRCVGFAAPPNRAQAEEPLVANLVAACHQLAKACDKYAEHVDKAYKQIGMDNSNIFHVDNPFDNPRWGGNGNDGGLNDAVLGDPHIHQLKDVPRALDGSQGRVHLTSPDGGGGIPFPFIPLPFPRIRVPAMQLASFNDVDLNIPARDPIPPDPNSGHRTLSPTEEKRFRTWMNSLPAEGFAGGGGPSNPDNAYQLRISGYPERKVPLPEHAPGISKKGLLVDGLRPSDGYAVEAKHVRDPDKCNTSRSLDAVNKTLARPPKIDAKGNMKWDPHLDSMYPKDEKSLRRYQAAMEDPRNKEIRGLEIVTNSKGSAAYWQSLMGMTGVKGDARYVP